MGPDGGQATLAVRVLGPLEVEVDGALVPVPRPQVRHVISGLALHHGEVVSADALCDHLWPGELPASPRKALNVVLSRVRTTLGSAADRLEADGDGYRLRADDVDATHFVRLVDRARRTDADPTSVLHDALSLWRGVPAADTPDSPLIEQTRGSLVEHHWSALTRLTELLTANGDHTRAATLAAPAVAAEPFRERLVAAYARALARDGRKVDALRAIDASIDHLRTELGLDPSAALVDVQRAVLEGAVQLDGAARLVEPTVGGVFVGREHELRRLAAVEPGRPIVVVGEPGIGKSELLGRAADHAFTAGRDVVTVAASRHPDRPLDAVARLCVDLVEMGAEPGERDRVVLARICPELDLPTVDAPLGRDALVAGIADHIDRAADGRLILVDDAHWLDAGSASVIEELMARGRSRMVVSMRPNDDPRLAFLRTAAERDTTIELGPLGADDVQELVTAAGVSAARAPALAATLVDRTGGNALFVRLLLDSAQEGMSPERAIPTSVLLAVRERLDTLADRTVGTVQLAAVVGRTFGFHTLRQLRPTADGDVDRAREAGLVEAEPFADEGRFVHQLVADACVELLPDGERILMHDEVARVLAADGAPAAERARHLVAASRLDPFGAVETSIEASAEFIRGYDWEAAHHHLDDAMSVVREHGVADPALLAELTVRRGVVGRALATDDYVDDLLAGAERADEIGDGELLAVAATELCGHGRSTRIGEVDARVVPLLDAALAIDLPSAHRAELCAAASALFCSTNQSTRGRKLYREAWELAADHDDVEVEASVLEHAHLGFAHPDDFDLLRRAAWRLDEIAGTDPGLAWEAAFLRFGVSAVLGDVSEVATAIADMRRHVPHVKERARDFGMAFSEVAYAQLAGELDAGWVHLERAVEVGAARYDPVWVASAQAVMALSLRDAEGRLGELAPVAEQMIAAAPTYLPYRIVAAATALANGDLDRSRAELDRVGAGGFELVPRDSHWTSLAVLLAGPVAAVGTPDEADALWTELLVHRGRMSWNGMCTNGPVDAALAQVARARGDDTVAAELEAAAAAMVERFRAAGYVPPPGVVDDQAA